MIRSNDSQNVCLVGYVPVAGRRKSAKRNYKDYYYRVSVSGGSERAQSKKARSEREVHHTSSGAEYNADRVESAQNPATELSSILTRKNGLLNVLSLGKSYLEYSVHTSPTPGSAIVVDIEHTYTPRHLRGRGYAGLLVKEAFRLADDMGAKVRPTCTYVSETFMPRNPEFSPLLEASQAKHLPRGVRDRADV